MIIITILDLFVEKVKLSVAVGKPINYSYLNRAEQPTPRPKDKKMSQLFEVMNAYNQSRLPSILSQIKSEFPNEKDLFSNCELHITTAINCAAKGKPISEAYQWFGGNSDQTLLDIFNSVAYQAEEDLDTFRTEAATRRYHIRVDTVRSVNAVNELLFCRKYQDLNCQDPDIYVLTFNLSESTTQDVSAVLFDLMELGVSVTPIKR